MFCSSVHPPVVFVVILPVHPLLVCYLYFRRDNKQLINSLGTSIKAQGESTKSAPASSSHSPQLGGFCRACLCYKSHLSYSRAAVCLVFLKPCLYTQGLWLCQSISGSVQGDSPSSRLCVHHPARIGSPTVGKVPCGEPQPWESEGRCCIVLLQAERQNITWWTGDTESTHTDFESCSA